MRRYAEDARRHASCTLLGLKSQTQGRNVRVAGTLAGIRALMTKKGDRMAFLKLEDETGSAEIVAFPEAFAAAEGVLTADAPLLVSGTVDGADGGSPTVKAEKIECLIQVRKQAVRRVTVRFTATGMSRADLDHLHQVLAGHPGPCAVRLRVNVPGQAEATVAAGETLRVAADDALLRDVERLLGKGSVVFG
jgi:DNA polymerase-3 subunit alpha